MNEKNYVNRDLIGELVPLDRGTFEIGEKFQNCSKDITKLILKKNNRYFSSLFYVGNISTCEVYSFDLLTGKTKTFFILLFNTKSKTIGTKKMGSFSSSTEFINSINKQIERITKDGK